MGVKLRLSEFLLRWGNYDWTSWFTVLFCFADTLSALGVTTHSLTSFNKLLPKIPA